MRGVVFFHPNPFLSPDSKSKPVLTFIVWHRKGTSRLKLGEGLKLYIGTQGYLLSL
jgi:hypothetical protein